MGEWLAEHWKYLVGLLVAGIAKPTFDYFKERIRGTAEASQITESSKMNTLQVSDKLLRDWMETASKATERIAKLESCLWKLLPIVEASGAPNAHEAVEEIKAILNTK